MFEDAVFFRESLNHALDLGSGTFGRILLFQTLTLLFSYSELLHTVLGLIGLVIR